MIRKTARTFVQKTRDAKNYLRWCYENKTSESIYFFTFHKCASTLFSHYVLKNLGGLRHIDYEEQIFDGKKWDHLVFKSDGFAYGPIRISCNADSVYQKLISPLFENDFFRNKIILFFIRDPRDILVSRYYSFGYSHSFSTVKETREIQKQQRHKIQNKTLDEYVIESIPKITSDFEILSSLCRACNRSTIIKYEDMIDNWDIFVENFTQHIDIKPSVLKQIYQKSRPRSKEDKKSHRRLGTTGGFKKKLQKTTIALLNEKYKKILNDFDYEM